MAITVYYNWTESPDNMYTAKIMKVQWLSQYITTEMVITVYYNWIAPPYRRVLHKIPSGT